MENQVPLKCPTPTMEKRLAVAALFSVLASPALAADLAVKQAPEYASPPQIYSWTGFYLGANAGVSAGTFNTSDQFGLFGSGDQSRASSKGFSGGGQLGYNYQLPGSNVVLGIEADFQGSTLQGSYDNTQVGGGAGWQDGSKVDWWGTARGRIGYAFGSFLPYATGGLAYGNVGTNGSCSVGPGLFSCDQSQGSVSGTHVGWTAGAGVEYAITRNLTFKAEYLYTDLGSVDFQNYFLDSTFGGPLASPGDDMRTKTTFSTLRVGVNYKFDAFASPELGTRY
jgi:outer membrane immunogenic protein